MLPSRSLTLRVIPVVFFLGLVFGLTTSVSAAGKVTTSLRLPVEGTIDVVDVDGNESQVFLSGTVHVVSQAFKTADGGLMVGLRANISSMKGEGDNSTGWVAVGANQYPPVLIAPPNPIMVVLPFELIPLGSEAPPNPISPVPVLSLVLEIDDDGHLIAEGSLAVIGVIPSPPPPR